jgi:alcohol dehydrogenase
MQTKAAVLYEQGRGRPYTRSQPLAIETVDLDDPKDDELLVEIAAAGLCHSDLSTIEGIRPRPVPLVMGHEAAGIVRAVGSDVDDVKVGDHVVMVFVMSCGVCAVCSGGRPHLCSVSAIAKAKGELIGGGHRLHLNGRPLNHNVGISCFAEYAVVSRGSVVVVDRDVPLEDAALFGCAVITGVGAVVNTAKVPVGATMAVVGLGGVGLNAMLGGVVAKAGRIFAIDVNDSKLELARALGATDTVNAKDPDCVARVREANGGGVDYVFEMAGSIEAWKAAYAIVGRGGTLTSAGLTPAVAEFAFKPYDLVSDEKTVKGSYMGSSVPQRDVPRFLELYKQGKLPVDKLRSGFLALDDINTGFDRLADGNVVRQILSFSE